LEMYLHVAITLARGWRGDDATELLRVWEEREGAIEDRAARQGGLDQLVPLAEMFRAFRLQLKAMPEDQLLKHLRATVPDAKTQPGRHVMHCLKYVKRENVKRDARVSDVVDSFHAQYLPYVDVFGTDGGNIPILKDALLEATCKRSA